MQMFDLKGKAAVVTGGNGGIGLGMARGLAFAGANLLLVGRDAGKNQRAREELQAIAAPLGARVETRVVDVTADDCGDVIAAATVELFGRYDILVNNAGTNNRKPPQDYTAHEWRALMDVNLTSAFLCSKAAYTKMSTKLGGHGGKIINIGSMTSIFGAPLATPYGASKGGIVQMSKALAAAWAGDGIQVNAVLPGWIDTDLTRGGRQSAPQMFARIVDRTPAGRWGVPDDLAGVAVFLASAASDFVTGTAIPVDGGYSVQA